MTCPECEGKLRKVFNAVGVVFKGSGFYRNDSRGPERNGSGGGSDTSPDKSAEKAPEKASEKTSEKKSDTAAKVTGS